MVELERRGAERVRHRGRELDVRAGLDGEQRSDEEQERDGERFHNLTEVNLASTCPRSSSAVART